MKRLTVVGALVLIFAFGVQQGFAGAPLKGVGVSLGKIPGGGAAAKESGSGGEVNFGVWPRGRYAITLSTAKLTANARGARPERLHVEVSGDPHGLVTHVLPAAAEGLAPIEVVSDGKTPLVVHIHDGAGEPVDWTARVKSHPNSANN